MAYPEGHVPELADQKQWNTCTVWAFSRVVRDILLTHFDFDPGSVDELANVIDSHNPTGTDGTKGIWAQALAAKFNDWFDAETFSISVKRGSDEKDAIKVRFRVIHDQTVWSPKVLRTFVHGQKFTHPQDNTSIVPRMYCASVVVGGSPAGNGPTGTPGRCHCPARHCLLTRAGAPGSEDHALHSMQAFACDGATCKCANSWGSNDPILEVPGKDFTKFVQADYFTLSDVHFLEGADAKWQKAELVEVDFSKLGGIAIGGSPEAVLAARLAQSKKVFIPSAVRPERWVFSESYVETLRTGGLGHVRRRLVLEQAALLRRSGCYPMVLCNLGLLPHEGGARLPGCDSGTLARPPDLVTVDLHGEVRGWKVEGSDAGAGGRALRLQGPDVEELNELLADHPASYAVEERRLLADGRRTRLVVCHSPRAGAVILSKNVRHTQRTKETLFRRPGNGIVLRALSELHSEDIVKVEEFEGGAGQVPWWVPSLEVVPLDGSADALAQRVLEIVLDDKFIGGVGFRILSKGVALGGLTSELFADGSGTLSHRRGYLPPSPYPFASSLLSGPSSGLRDVDVGRITGFVIDDRGGGGVLAVCEEGQRPLFPDLHQCDLAVALRGAYFEHGFAFSLNPDPKLFMQGEFMHKAFCWPGWLAGTRFGEVMFYADYLLKKVTFGDHHIPGVPPPPWAGRQLKEGEVPTPFRTWLDVAKADLQTSRLPDGRMFASVGELNLRISTRQIKMKAAKVEDLDFDEQDFDGPVFSYAARLSNNPNILRNLARAEKAFDLLEQLAKAWALASLLKDLHVPCDRQWAEAVATPTASTDALVPQIHGSCFHGGCVMQGDAWQRHHGLDFRIAQVPLPETRAAMLQGLGREGGEFGSASSAFRAPWVPGLARVARCSICESLVPTWVGTSSPQVGDRVQAFYRGIRPDHIEVKSMQTAGAVVERLEGHACRIKLDTGETQRVPVDYIFPEINPKAKAFQTDEGNLICGKCHFGSLSGRTRTTRMTRLGCCGACSKPLCEQGDQKNYPYWSISADGAVTDFHYKCRPTKFDTNDQEKNLHADLKHGDFGSEFGKRLLEEKVVPEPEVLRAQRHFFLERVEQALRQSSAAEAKQVEAQDDAAGSDWENSERMLVGSERAPQARGEPAEGLRALVEELGASGFDVDGLLDGFEGDADRAAAAILDGIEAQEVARSMVTSGGDAGSAYAAPQTACAPNAPPESLQIFARELGVPWSDAENALALSGGDADRAAAALLERVEVDRQACGSRSDAEQQLAGSAMEAGTGSAAPMRKQKRDPWRGDEELGKRPEKLARLTNTTVSDAERALRLVGGDMNLATEALLVSVETDQQAMASRGSGGLMPGDLGQADRQDDGGKVSLLMDVAGVSEATAARALLAAGQDVELAVEMLLTQAPP